MSYNDHNKGEANTLNQQKGDYKSRSNKRSAICYLLSAISHLPLKLHHYIDLRWLIR